jgi:hypothetical protein
MYPCPFWEIHALEAVQNGVLRGAFGRPFRASQITMHLTTTRTPRAHVSNDVRAHIHSVYHESGWSCRAISRRLKYPCTTVRRILKGGKQAMPRPADTYAHSQFTPVEPVDPDPNKATVRCVHCNTWTGTGRSLERKKAHLLKCPQYGEWRAAGNGEELQPTQSYAKRTSFVWKSNSSPLSAGAGSYQPAATSGSISNLVQNQDE